MLGGFPFVSLCFDEIDPFFSFNCFGSKNRVEKSMHVEGSATLLQFAGMHLLGIVKIKVPLVNL